MVGRKLRKNKIFKIVNKILYCLVCFSSLAIFLYSYYCNRRQLDNEIQLYCRASSGTQGQSRGAKKSRNSGEKIAEENSGTLLRRLFFRCFYFPSSPLAAPGSPRVISEQTDVDVQLSSRLKRSIALKTMKLEFFVSAFYKVVWFSLPLL